MHSLICGMTESGKTTLATVLCRAFAGKGFGTIVLDPMTDSRWPEETIKTSDPASFLKFLQENERYFCFIDEGGEMIGRYNDEMNWLATRSRHFGHSCYFISQRPSQMAPVVRHQSAVAFLFACGMNDVDLFAEEWNEPTLKNATRLQPFDFFQVRRFAVLRRGKVDIGTGAVTLGDAGNVEQHGDGSGRLRTGP